MKNLGPTNIVLIVILFFALVCLSVFGTINRNFKDAVSANSFMTKTGIYTDMSNLVRLKIQEKYPPVIENNILLRGLANKLVDVVVTPEIVAKAAKPAIDTSYAFAQGPTELLNDRVVLMTDPYKQQAKAMIGDLDLPRILVVNGDLLIDSIPAEFTIVNLEKHPNSVFGLILKARGLFEKNKIALDLSWLVIIMSLIFFLIHGIRHLRNLVTSLSISFGSAGLFVVIVSLLMPWIMRVSLPTAATEIAAAENNIVSKIVLTLFSEFRDVSYFFLGIAVILALLWKFVQWEKLQVKVNKMLKKIHVPTIHVEVKS